MATTTYKLSNRLFGSARLVTIDFPISEKEIEDFVNKAPTSGRWEVTSKISDWTSDFTEEYDRAQEMSREFFDK